MRLEATSADNQYKARITDAEFEDLERIPASQRDHIIIRLGGRVGLRSFEIP